MAFEPTSRKAPNKVQRLSQRGAYDEETVFATIDRAAVCHATFKLQHENDDTVEDLEDWPVIIPMIFGRKDSTYVFPKKITAAVVFPYSRQSPVSYTACQKT